MFLYSLIFPIISLIAVLWFIKLYRKRKISWITLTLWTILWILVILFALIPETSMFFAEFFGITRGLDFIIILVFVVLFYTILRLYFLIEKLQKDMNKIVKELAIKNEITLDEDE